MKILMLGWELPPYNSGGLGVACYQLAQALAAQGANIRFVLPSTARFEPSTFMEVVSPGKPPLPILSARQGAYDGDIEAVTAIRQEYEQFVETLVTSDPPDMIHAHDWLTLSAGVKAKQKTNVPLIAHVHATEFDRAGDKTGNPFIHDIEQHGLMMADHIVAVSEATKRLLVERYQLPAEKIEVIHNSAELLPTYQADLVAYKYLEKLKAEGYVIVATIGRLTVQKGLSHFLRAAALAHHRYSRFVFLITGDGEQRDELIELSADLGISDAVLFTGFVRGQAWRDVYSLADVFVMSSVSEPFGLTALEAAQHNTAIALTNQSGVGEVLQNVLRYDYWDEERLADQLIALALSDSLRLHLAAQASHEVRQLSWQSVAGRFVQRYQALQGSRL